MKFFKKSSDTPLQDNKNQLSNTLSKHKVPVAIVFVVLFAAAGTIILGFGRANTTVACSGLNRTYGAAETSVDIPHDGTYKVWSRIMAPDSENNSYYLGVASDDCHVVGDAVIPANEWTWVDYKNNDSTDKIDLSLSAGTQQIQMIGREADVKLDRVIVSSDLECVPTGTGDNCVDTAEEPQGNMLLNPDLDTFTTGEADNWTFMADGTTVYETSEYTYTGGSAQKIHITDNPGWGLVMYQTPDNFPTGNYEIHLVYKADADVKVEVANQNFSEQSFTQTMPATNGEWVAEALTFTHDNGNATDIRLSHPNTGTFLVDHYGLYSEGEAPVLPGTPEEGDSDTTAPTVSLTSPSDGATVSNATTVTADASDDTGVSQVEFFVDGSTTTADTASPYEFDWDTTTATDGSHTLKAVASDAAGNTASNSIGVTVNNADSEAPTAPTNLATTAVAANQVDLTWDAATDNVGVDHYNVYRDDTLIARTNETSYADTTVTENTTYSYHVIAVDAAGNESAPSSSLSVTTPQTADTQAPTTPGSLSATAVDAGQVDLSWNASTDDTGVDGYYVYRDDAVIATLGANATSYADTSVSADTTYVYYVKAFDAAGNVSAASNAETVTTPTSGDAETPSTPANLQATSPNKHQVNLTWDASTDNVAVSYYEVFRDGSQLGTTTTTSFGDGTVKPNKTYDYTVRAVDTSGNKSSFSNAASVSVLSPGQRKNK